MRSISICLIILAVFSTGAAQSQNILINILTQNSGMVVKGKTVYLEVSICNTDASRTLDSFKLKPQISIPTSLLSLSDTGHIIPAGWGILINSGSVITLTNGIDMIPPGACRTILISMTGKQIGSPQSILGSLQFSNGKSPGVLPGAPPPGEIIGDNISSTSCKVIR